jgi:Zinc carboxypeptidase
VSRLFIAVALLTVLISPAVAEPASIAPSTAYNPVVPTLQSVLGYSLGEQFTPYSEVERYYKTLAGATDRVKLEAYGKTYEGRTLYTVIISSPKNLARLDAIRAATAKLADPRKTTPEEAQKLATDTPVVLWYSYNVHGNEAASSEAAMQFAYELAASQDERVRNWLDNAVMVIDPMANPDGRDRYVNFYKQNVGAYPRADRFAAEHNERWPGGRPNHYLFDLNRDWAWMSQTETVARAAAYLKWNPQVDVDFHEMGPQSTYFFFPPAKPILPWIAPLLSKWYDIYGKGNAAALDKNGSRYFTKEEFDLFYPSYGDIWPALNGAVGMTYEQGGGGAGGLKIDLPDNQRTLTLRDRATNHFVTSIATLDTSVKNREARLRDFYEFHRAAIQAGQQGPVRQYYLVPGRDPERTAHVIDVLLQQGVEVKRAAADFDAEDLISYWGEKSASKRLPAGTYVIDLAQPAGFLASALLQRDIPRNELFFYDVSGWALPLAANVEGYASSKSARVELKAATDPLVPAGSVDGPAQPAAYVFATESGAAVRMLGQLLNQNIKAYVSLKPIKIDGQQFPAGSIVVPTDTNSPDLASRMTDLAAKNDCKVFATPTLMSEEGIDLGSNRMRFLRKPKIAILTDAPVSSTDYGALWYLFEQRLEFPFTPLRTENLGQVELSNYNVLILPADGGDGRGYSRALDKGLTAKISEWVRNGGVLIAIRGGAVWASKGKSGLTSVTYHFVRPDDEQARIDEEKAVAASAKSGEASAAATAPSAPPASKDGKDKDADKKQSELDAKLIKYADREKKQRAEEVPGTILRVALDNTHPLGFGFDEQLPVLNDTAPIFDLSSKGENVAYYPKDNLKLSGFISPENEKKIVQTAFLIRERQGRGEVILFADNPVFRGFWDGTTRLLLNSIFFGNITDPNIQ